MSQPAPYHPGQPVPADGGPPGRARNLGDVVNNCQDAVTALASAVGAYSALNRAYQTLTGTLPPGERPRALPTFAFRASADGVKAVDGTVDLKHVDPQYLPYILVPMANAQQAAVREAAATLTALAAEAVRLIDATAPVAPAPGGP